jgi:hypothetical protein
MTKNFPTGKEQESVEQRKKEAERIHRRNIEDLRWILDNARGRRFLWRIISLTGVFRTSYVPKDTNQTHVNLGQQQIGLGVVAEITEADPAAILKMQNEFISEQSKGKNSKEEEEDDELTG